jgi:hypothetical protein
VPTCASIAHFGAPSDQETSDYPCSYVLLLIDWLVVVEHYEFKTIIANDLVPVNLIQYSRDGEEAYEKYSLPFEPVGPVVLDNAVEGTAEAGDPAIEKEIECGAYRNQDTTYG